ncbi:hypothetical protein NKG05_04475 [Oerskovia sp. M15]
MSQDTSAPDAIVVEEATVVVGPSLLARLGAEAFGTFFLVLAILGVALYSVGGLGAARSGWPSPVASRSSAASPPSATSPAGTSTRQ